MGVSKAAPGLGTSTERRGGRIPLDRQEDNMKTLVSKSSACTLEEVLPTVPMITAKNDLISPGGPSAHR